MKDSDIDYSDIPPLGNEFFEKATVAWPPAKQQLTIRGEREQRGEDKGSDWFRREVHYGSFERSFESPGGCKAGRDHRLVSQRRA